MLRKLRFFWQRLTRGWDESETWSLDYTVARFIIPRLKFFRDNLHGHPDRTPSGKPLTFEGWQEIIDKMIFSFEHIADESWEDKFYMPDPDIPEDAPMFDENGQYISRLKDFDKKGYMAVQKKIDEGIKLFGLYFRHLWN